MTDRPTPPPPKPTYDGQRRLQAALQGGKSQVTYDQLPAAAVDKYVVALEVPGVWRVCGGCVAGV
jgi:hypothetical protein